jgi:predicted nucleic acid-binding protein
LEVCPKAAYYGHREELAFYREFFRSSVIARRTGPIVTLALREAERSGIAAMDALHIAAAHLLKADVFITTEKPTKPMYRTSLVEVRYLYDL